MICKMCATGADMIQRANEIEESDKLSTDERNLEDLRALGQHLHYFCSGRTHCDCQHKESLSG